MSASPPLISGNFPRGTAHHAACKGTCILVWRIGDRSTCSEMCSAEFEIVIARMMMVLLNCLSNHVFGRPFASRYFLVMRATDCNNHDRSTYQLVIQLRKLNWWRFELFQLGQELIVKQDPCVYEINKPYPSCLHHVRSHTLRFESC